MLSAPAGEPAAVYVRLGESAIATRRRTANKKVSAMLSGRQRRWLREASEVSGRGIDEEAILRALVDLGMELEIDWPLLAGGGALRRAVRESVTVRRRAAG